MQAARTCRTSRRFPILEQFAVAIACAPFILSPAQPVPNIAKPAIPHCRPVFVAKCEPGTRPVCVRRSRGCCVKARCKRR